jgi:hypothetical protein
LFQRPELIYRVDRLLQQHDLAPLAAEDFTYTDGQVAFDIIRQAVEQDEIDPQAFVVQSMPASLAGFSRELLSMTEQAEVLDERLLEELLRAVHRLREDAASERRTHYRFLQEEAQENGDLQGVTDYQGEVLKLTQLKRVLDKFNRELSLKRMQ